MKINMFTVIAIACVATGTSGTTFAQQQMSSNLPSATTGGPSSSSSTTGAATAETTTTKPVAPTTTTAAAAPSDKSTTTTGPAGKSTTTKSPAKTTTTTASKTTTTAISTKKPDGKVKGWECENVGGQPKCVPCTSKGKGCKPKGACRATCGGPKPPKPQPFHPIPCSTCGLCSFCQGGNEQCYPVDESLIAEKGPTLFCGDGSWLCPDQLYDESKDKGLKQGSAFQCQWFANPCTCAGEESILYILHPTQQVPCGCLDYGVTTEQTLPGMVAAVSYGSSGVNLVWNTSSAMEATKTLQTATAAPVDDGSSNNATQLPVGNATVASPTPAAEQ